MGGGSSSSRWTGDHLILQLLDNPLNQAQAQEACQELFNTSLASIHNRTLRSESKSLLSDAGVSADTDPAWTGLIRVGIDQWAWYDHRPWTDYTAANGDDLWECQAYLYDESPWESTSECLANDCYINGNSYSGCGDCGAICCSDGHWTEADCTKTYDYVFCNKYDYVTTNPTSSPTPQPTGSPTKNPSKSPSDSPTRYPSVPPTQSPSGSPSMTPTISSGSPTSSPSFQTAGPSFSPTQMTGSPTISPTKPPTFFLVVSPTQNPTQRPTPMDDVGNGENEEGDDENGDEGNSEIRDDESDGESDDGSSSASGLVGVSKSLAIVALVVMMALIICLLVVCICLAIRVKNRRDKLIRVHTTSPGDFPMQKRTGGSKRGEEDGTVLTTEDVLGQFALKSVKTYPKLNLDDDDTPGNRNRQATTLDVDIGESEDENDDDDANEDMYGGGNGGVPGHVFDAITVGGQTTTTGGGGGSQIIPGKLPDLPEMNQVTNPGIRNSVLSSNDTNSILSGGDTTSKGFVNNLENDDFNGKDTQRLPLPPRRGDDPIPASRGTAVSMYQDPAEEAAGDGMTPGFEMETPGGGAFDYQTPQ